MSKTPPLIAAIKRLNARAAWDGDTSPDPYRDAGHTLTADLKLVLRALDHLDEAKHIDDRDAEPVFEVRPACSWQLARKGLVHCLGAALAEEDSET